MKLFWFRLNNPELISLEEVCANLRISKDYLLTMMSANRFIKPNNIVKSWTGREIAFFRKDDYQDWLEFQWKLFDELKNKYGLVL